MASNPPPGQQPLYNTALSPDLMAMQSRPRVSFTGVSARVFPLKASMNTLQDFCDNNLNFPDDQREMKASQRNYFRPAVPYVYFQMINYGKMATESANLGWIAQNEILFCIPLEWYKVDADGRRVFHDWAMTCPFIFVDNDASLTTGREVYGWSKVRGWLDWVATSWTHDPREDLVLMSMATEVFPELYVGAQAQARSLIEVRQNQAPPISPSLLTRRDPFNPLWGLPQALRGALKLTGDMAELVTNLPILGYQRRDAASLGRMSLSAASMLRSVVPWLRLRSQKVPDPAAGPGGRNSPNLAFNQVTLKQFRDAGAPDLACYQALVNSRITVDHYYDIGLLGGPNVLVGDLSGGFSLNVHEYAEQPIVTTLGLEVDEYTSDEHETRIATLKPVCPFWLSADLRYDTGETLAWRGKASSVWQSAASSAQQNDPQGATAGNRYNTARGPAIQEIPGPFHYPDATLRVFPLLADQGALARFCDDYLNDLDADGSGTVAGNRFEPLGNYVYMIVTTFGDEEGGKMWTEGRNIGQLADREVSFCVPVRWFEVDGGEKRLKSVALLTPYVFASSSRQVISEREINGRPLAHSVIESLDDSWLQESGPVRPSSLMKLKTLLIPALNVGQAAKMLDLVEITEQDVEKYNEDIPWAVIRAKWEPELERDYQRKLEQRSSAGDRWPEVLQMFRDVVRSSSVDYLSLKQYRATESADRACYQSMVMVRRQFRSILDIREIHDPAYVRIHKYSTMPIVERLGLKVRATDTHGDAVVECLEPIRPFFIRGSLRDGLGVELCRRVNTEVWEREGELAAHHQAVELSEAHRRSLESLDEPKAALEYLLSESFGAHDPGYHDYDTDKPINFQARFGMKDRENRVVLNVNKPKPDQE
jgi:hypothetical protein